MRYLASLAGVALLFAPLPSAAQAEAAGDALARENAVWQAVKGQKIDAFSAMMGPSYVGLYPNGPRDLATEVGNIKGATLGSFEISSFDARSIDSDTIAVTYRVDVAGQAQGAPFSGRYWCASVWHRTAGQWHGMLHTQTLAVP